MRSARRVVCFVALLAATLLAAPALAQDSLAPLGREGTHVAHAPKGGRLVRPGLTRVESVREFLRARLDEPTLRDLIETRSHDANGVEHKWFAQQVAGLDVYGTYAKASFSASGDLLNVIENLVPTSKGLRPAQVGPEEALRVVLANRYPEITSALAEVSSSGNVMTYERRPPFREAPTVTRTAVPLLGNALDTGYLVQTWDRSNVLRYTVVSGRGQILSEQVRTANEAFRVFPNSPAVTPQVLVTSPANPIASPLGWLGLSTTTTGNNVDAYLDRNNDDLADALNGRPIAANQIFDFTWNGAGAPTDAINQLVAVTNLFYLTNVMHDRLYSYGFTESAGNFQTNNFGKGGIGNDPLNAEAQDGGGTNNANFATPVEGQPPRMQMYLWTNSTPNRDGSLDSDIVYHEYTHGLTWRMVGDMGGVMGGAVGEGMSDAVACYFNNDDRVAEYSSNNPIGIRQYPYTNYPRTYRYVVGYLGPHLDGEIYAATLWRLRQLWLAKGWSQDTLMKYLVDGLNYTPQKPAYEMMRDGILQSVQNMPTELNPQQAKCTVWDAFAQYGIGVGAVGQEIHVDPFGFSLFMATESFTKPAECTGGPANTPPTVNITAPANNASFVSGTSVTFTGTASDTEDGSLTNNIFWTSNLQGTLGGGGTFSRSDLVVGTHTITASVTDSSGAPGSATVTITITAANTPPTVTITSPVNNSSVTAGTSVTFTGSASDTQDGNLTASLAWTSNLQGAIGTGGTFSRSDLMVGTHTVMAKATDSGSLNGTATVTITITAPPNTAPTVTITAPANGASFTKGSSITFAGSSTDTQDGNLTAGLKWSSSLQGQVGTGGTFSRSDLLAGTHTITASSTDSGTLTGTKTASITVMNFTLAASGSTVKGKRQAALTWSGATGTNVGLYRNNALISTTPNDGVQTDTNVPKNTNTFTYKVCLTATPTVCSSTATVSF